VSRTRPPSFRGRHFEDVIIILCVRWYLRYSLSYRDLKEMMPSADLQWTTSPSGAGFSITLRS
jgi:transposase-like protein